MTALTTLGIIVLIIVCFGPAIDLINVTSGKQTPSKIDKNGKRELKINRIIFLDYLILILPLGLLLIGLFSKNLSERNMSFMILGIGFMIFTLSSNNRIDIPKINLFILTICTITTITYLVFKSNPTTNIPTGIVRGINSLIYPIIAYIFIHSTRQIIKWLTGNFPITMMKYDKVGQFNFRFQRKTTYWDLIWSITSLFIFPLLIVYLALEH